MILQKFVLSFFLMLTILEGSAQSGKGKKNHKNEIEKISPDQILYDILNKFHFMLH